MTDKPLRLYKYRSFSATSLAMLVDRKVWLPKPVSLNDPFDCAASLDRGAYTAEIMDAHRAAAVAYTAGASPAAALTANWPGNDHQFEEVNAALKKMMQEFGLFCLSGVPDSTLMWSHYCENHTGFCVEFDNAPTSGLYPLVEEVRYSDAVPSLGLTGTRDEAKLRAMFLTKATAWSYESEWRVVKETGNVAIEMPSSPTKIIFGSRMPRNNRTTIKNIMREDVAYAVAEPQPGSFVLKIVEDPK